LAQPGPRKEGRGRSVEWPRHESDGTGRQAAKGGLQWVVDGRVAGEWEGVRGKKKSGDTIRASCERRGDGSWPDPGSQGPPYRETMTEAQSSKDRQSRSTQDVLTHIGDVACELNPQTKNFL